MATDWRIKRPSPPPKPCKSIVDLLKISCAAWGLDYDRYRTGKIRPCIPCRGGTKGGTEECPYCRGTGQTDDYSWRGYYAAVMAEYQDAYKLYQETVDMHMAIKRRLTGKERNYVSIE